MSFNGSGTFSIINTFVPGTVILSSAVNQNYTDIASGLSNTMCKDGQQIAGANQNLGNFRLTNLHAGTARSDSANLAQLQDGLVNWAVAGSTGSANAIIATYSPPHTALADGDVFFLRAIASTTSTTPTFNPDGLGANTITKQGGAALATGDIAGNNYEAIFRYNAAGTRFELLNPAPPPANTAGTGINLSGTQILIDPSYMQGYLGGLTLAGVAGSTTTTINSGICCSDDNTTLMKLGATYTKTFAAWAVGSGNGFLDVGASACASSWYHIFVVERTDTGVVDLLASLSASAPTLPASYTKQRRIGAIRAGSVSTIVGFSQNGDEFVWLASPHDVNAITVSTASRTLQTLTVPTGVKVNALVRAGMTSGSASGIWITSPDENDQAPPAGDGNDLLVAASGVSSGRFNVRTNTSAQIGVRAAASSTFDLYTFGWIDTRGRNS